MIIHCRIKGKDKTWKQFVQNCANEIRKLMAPDSWSHCSDKVNPVGIPSRKLTLLEFSVNVLWRNGLDWLCGDEPDGDNGLQLPDECLAKLRVKDQQFVHGLLMTRGHGQTESHHKL